MIVALPGLFSYFFVSIFCHHWGIAVNLEKTKSLVFSPASWKKDINITLQGINLENIKSYSNI